MAEKEVPPPYYSPYDTTSTASSTSLAPSIPSPQQHAFHHHLYIGCLGYVHCIDKRSGSPIWKSTLTGTGFNPVWLVAVPERNQLLCGSGVNLRCISVTNGQQVYENKLKGLGLGCVTMALGPGAQYSRSAMAQRLMTAASGDKKHPIDPADICFVCNGTQVRALRISDGKDLWEFVPGTFKKGNVGDMLVEDNVLFVTSNGSVFALDIFTGKQLWYYYVGNMSYSTLATMASGNDPAVFHNA
ncbi:hypothetical protein HDU96_008565 [Phlyctochytrium bullatum]|nr:hypothetical protein HDU96_008565 [Phlyctochytrium bullatum]